MNAPKLAVRLLGEEHWAITRTIMLLVEDGLRFVSLVPEVFLHTGFGQRYLSVEIVMAMAVLVVLPVLNFVPSASCKIAAGLFLALAGWHLVAIWWRNRHGVYIHSRYTGSPHFVWWYLHRWIAIDEIMVKRWLEPGLVLAASIALQRVDPQFSVFLGACGTALAMRVSLEYRRWRDRVLDLLDAQLEGELMNETLREGRDSRDVAGCPTVAAFAAGGEAKEALARALNGVEGLKEEAAANGPTETKVELPRTETPGFAGLDPTLQAFLQDAQHENGEARESARCSPMAIVGTGDPGGAARTDITNGITTHGTANGNGRKQSVMVCRCPWCDKKIRMPVALAGRAVACPNEKCRKRFEVPA